MGRRTGRVTALLLVAAGVLGLTVACSEDAEPQLDYVVDARLSTVNANTVAGNADGALMAVTRVFPGFSYLGASGQVTPDRDIGTVTAQPGPVLTLRYQFAPDAVFSDGRPLDCDDLVLAWAAMSGRLPGFTPATTAGYRDITDVRCAPGDKSATVTFAPGRDYRDWLSLFGAGTLLPAQVVARDAQVADVIEPIRAMNRPVIAKIAKAWNTGFDLRPGAVEDATFPSSGPYRISSYGEGGLVLSDNPKWWGDAPKVSRIVLHDRRGDAVRRIADGRYDIADVTAGLTDGDATASDAGAADQVQARDAPGRSLGVEELVFSGSGAFADPAVRRAFASCVPRDRLTRGFGQGAQVWNLRTLAPADDLAAAINNEFGQGYFRVDPARTRALLTDAGRDGPLRVRIGYLAPDDRRRQMVAAIADSCRGAGITVVDAGSPQISVTDLGTDVDAILVVDGASMAAAGAADPIRDAQQLRGGDPLNLAGFRDPQVSAAIDALAVAQLGSDRLELVRTIENAAWASVPSLPLFAAPRVRRWNDRVGNAVAGLARNGTGWNMDRWTILK